MKVIIIIINIVNLVFTMFENNVGREKSICSSPTYSVMDGTVDDFTELKVSATMVKHYKSTDYKLSILV